MSYYTVLSATSALFKQQHFTLNRCRRRFNGPHRYILHDEQGHIFHFDDLSKKRRTGYTLQELIDWLVNQPNAAYVTEARALLHDLDNWQQLKAANF